jgi:hypothetical protein
MTGEQYESAIGSSHSADAASLPQLDSAGICLRDESCT